MNQEDALKFILECLRNPREGSYSNYGYDLYIPNVVRAYCAATGQQGQGLDAEADLHRRGTQFSPHFYAAAWDLARRGVLRPGVCILGAQATQDGGSGNGYSVTPFGHKWLAEASQDDVVPTEPSRFASMLEPFRARFGPGFYERAQEAVRCYGAHAYLGCAAMCGAAAESVLLATAIAREGSEDAVLKQYSTSSGRGRVEASLLGQAPEQLRREFQGLTVLLKYWRDEAAHGRASQIGDNEAYTSVAMLLRLAKLTTDNWSVLAGRGA